MGATSVTVVPGSHEAWATGGPTGILRFDGRRWVPSPTPQPADKSLWLYDIYARSPSDVWAVGRYRNSDDREEVDYGNHTLVVHWNGREWTIMRTPSVPIVESGDGGELTDVVALAPDNVWAVGEHRYDGLGNALVQRWNGSEWTTVAGGGLPDRDSLGPVEDHFNAVIRAPYSTTLWFLGSWRSDGDGSRGPLLQRHKSGGWTEPLAPDMPAAPQAGAALSWDDIWAVGHGNADGSAVALHKNAFAWNLVPTPKPAIGGASLRSVAAVSSTNVWAVGNTMAVERTENGGHSTVERPLIEHWDGSSWSMAPSPLDGSRGVLYDIALRKSGWGWVVGTNTIMQACGI